MSSEAINLPMTRQMKEEGGQQLPNYPSSGLVKNFNRLLEKQVKLMENMTMEDFGFQQRVLQRMMELTAKKEEDMKKQNIVE